MNTDTGLRAQLLNLHRAIVETERVAYERAHGRVTDRAFLDLLIQDASFSWLRPLTAMIVRLDELREGEEEGSEQALKDCELQVRRLLKPGNAGDAFQRKYADILQNS